MTPYLIKILKAKLVDWLAEPVTRQVRNQIFREVIEANVQKDSSFCFIEIELRALLKAQYVTTPGINAAFERLTEIESINSLCGLLEQLIKSEITLFESSRETHYKRDPSELVIRIVNEAQIRDDLTQWVNDEYAPVDERIEVSRRTKVRRFDSLARILSSQVTSISVCGAVTIDTTTLSPRLIVGANLSRSTDDTPFLNVLSHKLKVLKNFYTEYTFGRKKLPDERACEQLAFDLYKALFPGYEVFSAPDEPNMLTQAVYKLTHALLYDPDTFTSEEKQAFLNFSSTIALLPTKADTGVEMQINYLTPGGKIQTTHHLGHKIQPHELKYIHAEQLIALFLYEQNKIPKHTRFIFGISKLCCATCSHFLKSYPAVEFRGHHQKQYQGVINLINGVRTANSSMRLGPTAPKKSPFKTPLKAAIEKSPAEEDAFDEEVEKSRAGVAKLGVFGSPVPRMLQFDSLDSEHSLTPLASVTSP